MATNEYHFITNWIVTGNQEEVYEILADAKGMERWWSGAYQKVEVLEKGDGDGVGQVVQLHTKGQVPDWSYRVTSAKRPNGFSLQAFGDFVGHGEWTLTQRGDEVEVTYDWRVSAEKPLLRKLSWLMKPMFSANHRRTMAQGEQGLRNELTQRKKVPVAH
jgi:hypothetical protein